MNMQTTIFSPSMRFAPTIMPHLCERAADAVINDTGEPTNIDDANNIFLARDDDWNLYLTTRCGRRYDVPYLSGKFVPNPTRGAFGHTAAAAAGAYRVGQIVAQRLAGKPTFSTHGERRDVGPLKPGART